MKQRIIKAMSFSGVILMPFIQGDNKREAELHSIARELKYSSKTLPLGSKRYGCVMIYTSEQKELL
jgi:hypothetical protein